jgi:hypothetical protein
MSEKITDDFQKAAAPFSSNCPPPRPASEDAGAGIRLSACQWVIVAVICLAVSFLIPAIWERLENFSPGPDYRIPYKLSNDYWLYERYCRTANFEYETLVIGDSVIWGHYVSRDNTLSHYLNEMSGTRKFANLGLDGIHPAAMEGLLRYYGKKITNKNIILHLNPLWMSTPKLDLQTEKEFNFNHPNLVPQFKPEIACYKASLSTRLSAVVRRFFTFPNWVSHLNITYFQGMDMPTWTLENPYKNPLRAVTFNLQVVDSFEQSKKNIIQPKNNPFSASDTTKDEITDNGYQWVRPEKSLQWSCFMRTIKLLRERDNHVFVLVGPFNEHMLEGTSLESYQRLKNEIEKWLLQNNIACYMPPVLPAKIYQDASHPLSEGYAMIAEQLLENESFNSTIFPADNSRTAGQ